MVNTNPITRVAAVIMSDGNVKFVPNEHVAVNTAIKQWKSTLSPEQKAKHDELGTCGGVVIVNMLSEDWSRMKKEFNPYE